MIFRIIFKSAGMLSAMLVLGLFLPGCSDDDDDRRSDSDESGDSEVVSSSGNESKEASVEDQLFSKAPRMTDYRPSPPPRTGPILDIYCTVAGRMEIQGPASKMLGVNESKYPRVRCVLGREDGSAANLFQVRFEPADGSPGTIRIFRVKPGEAEILRTLESGSGGSWILRVRDRAEKIRRPETVKPKSRPDKPVKEPLKVTVKEPVREPVKAPSQKPVKESVIKPAKEPVKTPVVEPVKEPVVKPVKEPVKPKIPVKEPIAAIRYATPEALAQYQKALKERTSNCIGKNVEWTLEFFNVAGSEKGYLLVARSRSGLEIEATFPTESTASLLKLDRGSIIRLKGKVGTYRRLEPSKISRFLGIETSGGEIVLEKPSVALAKKKQIEEFQKTSVPRSKKQTIVFVADRSGSMIDSFDTLKSELVRTIAGLNAGHSYHFIFMTKKFKELPSTKAVPALGRIKKLTANYLNAQIASGQTSPIPSINRAFDVLQGVKGDKIILIVADGFADDGAALLQAIAAKNKDRSVKVFTILWNGNDATGKTLKQIGSENGGKFMSWKSK